MGAIAHPTGRLSTLGGLVLELRVAADPRAGLAPLREHGAAPGDAFAVGTTVIIPIRDQTADAVLDAARAAGIAFTATSARPPTLDDVYLRLTGDTLAA
jgi:hypothetical protein